MNSSLMKKTYMQALQNSIYRKYKKVKYLTPEANYKGLWHELGIFYDKHHDELKKIAFIYSNYGEMPYENLSEKITTMFSEAINKSFRYDVKVVSFLCFSKTIHKIPKYDKKADTLQQNLLKALESLEKDSPNQPSWDIYYKKYLPTPKLTHSVDSHKKLEKMYKIN